MKHWRDMFKSMRREFTKTATHGHHGKGPGQGSSLASSSNGDRKAAHRHLLSSLRRGSCRDRSRYLGQVHIPLSLRCPVCSGEPGNLSELQQHIAEHLCDVFRNDGIRDAFLGQAQGSGRAGPSSSETGGGRREKRPRCHSAPGGRAGGLWSTRQN